jgi:archaeal flagellar protein FlaJ
MKRDLYFFLSSFYPESYKRYFKKLLIYSGDNVGARYWLGIGMTLALVVFFIPLLYVFVFFNNFTLLGLLAAFASFFGVHFFIFLRVNFKVQERTAQIEKALPDFLQLVAANIRAGMTPYQAMKLSSREEFGPLKEEIDFATNKALGTENFLEAILEVRERVQSDVLNRALQLLTSSLKTGGHLAILLEELAVDVIENRELKEELATSTKTYSLFILFTVLVGSPLLLAISINFLESIITIQDTTGQIEGGIVSEVLITVPFFVTVSIVFLVLTSFFSSMLMGVIKEGKFLYGLRYAPLVAIGSVTLLVILRFLISGFLG